MLKRLTNGVLCSLDFLVCVAVGALLVHFFYAYALYPFDSINILYYFAKTNYFFPQKTFFSIIIFYLFTVILGLIYIITYRKMNLGRIPISIIVTISIFIIYSFILILGLGIDRFKQMETFLIQDFLGMLIFYLTLALLYRRISNAKN
jgi:uncharacterized membrane protein YagU involved in acid resistance